MVHEVFQKNSVFVLYTIKHPPIVRVWKVPLEWTEEGSSAPTNRNTTNKREGARSLQSE